MSDVILLKRLYYAWFLEITIIVSLFPSHSLLSLHLTAVTYGQALAVLRQPPNLLPLLACPPLSLSLSPPFRHSISFSLFDPPITAIRDLSSKLATTCACPLDSDGAGHLGWSLAASHSPWRRCLQCMWEGHGSLVSSAVLWPFSWWFWVSTSSFRPRCHTITLCLRRKCPDCRHTFLFRNDKLYQLIWAKQNFILR